MRKRSRWIWGAASVVLIAAAGVAAYIGNEVRVAANRMYEPLSPARASYEVQDPELQAWRAGVGTDETAAAGGTPAGAQAWAEAPTEASAETAAEAGPGAPAEAATAARRSAGAFTVLLAGVDEREGDRGRTDTLMVLTVNEKRESALMFSIPRDTYAELYPKGTKDKINHAYAFSGIEGTVATVEHFLDMPIDHYIKVNMEGFAQIVDTLGGVDVTNTIEFDYLGVHFPVGQLHLNGAEALDFTRMRYDDPRGDFGRNERQRQVLNHLVNKAADWKNSLDITRILKSVSRSVKTDFTLAQLTELVTKHRGVAHSVQSTEVRGQGKMMGGIYYYMVDSQERKRLHDEMKSYLMDGGS